MHSPWTSLLICALALSGVVALRPRVTHGLLAQRSGARMRFAAALRLSLVLLIVAIAVAELIARSPGLTRPARWLLWAAAALLGVPLTGNVAAGLWLLTRLTGVRRGDIITAGGHTGRIARYASTRLELETEAGWTAYLPYVTLVRSPLLVSRKSRAQSDEIRLEQEHWTEDKLRFLYQAAILSPYRDVTSPVRVACDGRIASVRVSLVSPGSPGRMQRYLQAALARHPLPELRGSSQHPPETAILPG